jgi:hypothetical protein
MSSNFFKRQRKIARTQSIQNSNSNTKILLVGPSQDEKSNFIKSFLPPDVSDNHQEHTLFKLGVDITPIKFQGKNYDLWDANPNHDSNHDENLILSSKGAKMIVVFGEDSSWYERMKSLFPATYDLIFLDIQE